MASVIETREYTEPTVPAHPHQSTDQTADQTVVQPAGMVLAVPAVVKWVGSSIGLGTLLVAIGYIVVSAREALLGVELHGAVSTADYALVGGRFFSDVMTLLQRRGADWMALLIGVLIVLALCAFAAQRFRVRYSFQWTPVSYVIAVLALAVLLALNWAYFDLPFAYIENVLLRAPGASLRGVGGDVSEHVDSVWVLFRSAHSGDLNEARRSAATLETRFVLNLFFTLLLAAAYAGLSIQRRRLHPDDGAVTWRTFVLLMRGVSALLILLNLFAIPYVYGKSIRSTAFPAVSLRFGDGVPEQYRMRTGILLAASDDTLTFYDDEKRLVWQMPRRALQLQQTLRTEDVVQKHFAMQ